MAGHMTRQIFRVCRKVIYYQAGLSVWYIYTKLISPLGRRVGAQLVTARFFARSLLETCLLANGYPLIETRDPRGVPF